MENQPNFDNFNPQPIEQKLVDQPKQIFSRTILGLVFLALIFLTAGMGYFFGQQSVTQQIVQSNSETNDSDSAGNFLLTATGTENQDTADDQTVDLVPSSSPSSAPESILPAGYDCQPITDLALYHFCKSRGDGEALSGVIIGPAGLKINRVDKYSLSPNHDWLLLVKFSAVYELGGAPTENALSMVETKSGQEFELFSQIYFPNFIEQSWAADEPGIVFTAASPATPDILGKPNMYAVVYCTTTCRVLATDAGPAGIGGDPAFFVDGQIHYTGMDGQVKKIDLE